MIRYKLTCLDMTTHNGCQWTVGEWKATEGNGELCGPGWLHCYTDPLLALLMNPIHANIAGPRLWEVEVEGECLTDHGLKEGWTRMRLVRELPMPVVTMVQRIRFGILCAMEVCQEPQWRAWADRWLSGADQTCTSGLVAEASARAASAAWAAEESVWAAEAAAKAARAAAKAAATEEALDFSNLAKKAMKDDK